LRKLEALKSEKTSENVARDDPLSESIDGSEDNEVFDQPLAKNRFDMLLEDSDNEGDADSEYSEQQSGMERPCGSFATQAINSHPASHLKVKKKKKKKKKKAQASSDNKTDASEDLELDEVEASVREVNELLGETELADSASAPLPGPSTSPREHLLSVEYRYLDAKQELQRIFGSDVVATERSRVRHQVRGVGRLKVSSKASLTGGQQHFLPHDNGISMVPDPDHRFNCRGKMAVYRYVHDIKYQMHQLRFDHALEAHDQEGVLELLHVKPHHIDTLLQLSGMFRSQDDFTYADELVQKAIMELEFSMMGCRLTEPTCSLDFKRMENRGLFYALFYQMLSVSRRQCFRSALELSKILLRLSADGDDPLAVILLIDFYAVRSQEYVWLLEYFRSYNEKQNLLMLPNFAYSVPLAHFFLSEQPGACVAHKALKQRLLGAQSEHYRSKKVLRATADAMLQQALIAFPEVFVKLMEANGVEPAKDISSSNHFMLGRWRTHPLHALSDLYATRMAPLWKQPEVLDWLTANARSVLELIQVGDLSVAQSKRLRMASNVSLPVPVMRHLIITQYPDVGEYVPISLLLRSHGRYHDVIPPSGSHRSYEKLYLSKGCYFLSVKINGIMMDALFDNGAVVSVISENLLDTIRPKPTLKNTSKTTLIGFGGARVNVIGEVTVTVEAEELCALAFTLLVMSSRTTSQSLVLGLDFLEKYFMMIDTVYRELHYSPPNEKPCILKLKTKPGIEIQSLVRTANEIVIGPNQRILISGKLSDISICDGTDGYIEPSCVVSGDVLDVEVAYSVGTVRNGHLTVELMNMNPCEVLLKPKTKLRVFVAAHFDVNAIAESSVSIDVCAGDLFDFSNSRLTYDQIREGFYQIVMDESRKEYIAFSTGDSPVTLQIGEYVLKIEDEITSVEIETFLKKVKNGKASGPNDIPYEFYKHSGESIIEMLRCLMRYGGVKESQMSGINVM
ncbi:Transcription factor 25, partial [Trinorchestia longiramus]